MVEDCMNMETKFDDISIAACPANMVGLIWNRVAPIIQRVVDRSPDDLTLFTIQERLVSGQNLLITIARGSEIIAVNVLDVKVLDSGKRILYIQVTGGDDLDDWMPQFLDVAKAIGKDYNCTEIRGMTARKGWMKKLKQYGWEETFHTIRCDIESE